MADPPQTVEGNLEGRSLGDVLSEMAGTERTGILTIQGRDDIIAISFLDGEVVAADALNQTVEEGLREVLVRRGILDAGEFMTLASEHQAGGGRVIDLLVERNYLNREQILEALREQTYRVLLTVLGWSEADYRFYAGDEVFYEEGLLPISVPELLIRSSRDLAPEGPLKPPIPDLAAVYRGVKTAGAPPDLTAGEREVLELVDGSTPCSQLMLSCDLAEFEMLLALHGLHQKGLVERRATATQEPRPEPRRAVADLPLQPPDSPGAVPGGGASPDRPAARAPEVAVPDKEPEPRVLTRRDRRLLLWLNRAVVGIALVGLAWVLVFSPSFLIYPSPWDFVERERVGEEVRERLYSRLDVAARTFFLVEGRFPHDLEAMVGLGLISDRDLWGPEGERLAISGGETSYILQVLDREGAAEGVRAEGIAGDLMLDPQYAISAVPGQSPLVLLD